MARPPRSKKLPSLKEDLDGEDTKVGPRSERSGHRARRARPFLIVLMGGAVGEMFLIRHPESIIGRARGATFHIDDEGVSRKHARLTCEGTDVRIEDLGSANGTFVNEQPVSESVLLKDGDKITLGSTSILKFTYSDDVDETFQRRMFTAALRDGLTKAYNKKYLLERIEKEIAFCMRHRTPLSLLLLDVDHFKRVNDTFGHPGGDAFLVSFADAVGETVRKEDVFARYGGEEFAVLCRAVDVEHAAVLGERLRARIAGLKVQHEQREIQTTISVGVAGFPEIPVSTHAELITAADEALYEAKRAGRDRVVVKRNSG